MATVVVRTITIKHVYSDIRTRLVSLSHLTFYKIGHFGTKKKPNTKSKHKIYKKNLVIRIQQLLLCCLQSSSEQHKHDELVQGNLEAE